MRPMILLSLVCVVWELYADDSTVAPKLAVAWAGPVADEIVVRATNWLANHVAQVSRAGQVFPKVAVWTPADIYRAALPLVHSNDLGVVVLWNNLKPTNSWESVWLKNRVAIVDIGSLKPRHFIKARDDKRYLWRIDKEIVRAAAMGLGMEPCPAFRCALMTCYSENDLDIKARNLCPPCCDKKDERLRVRGAIPPGSY